MPSTAYARGRQFEYRVKRFFEKLGYVVTRSPKSKSPVDLFVIGHELVLFVQCKVDGVLPPIEWNALLDRCNLCCAIPVLIARDAKRKLVCYHILERKEGQRRQPRVRFEPFRNVEREVRAA